MFLASIILISIMAVIGILLTKWYLSQNEKTPTVAKCCAVSTPEEKAFCQPTPPPITKSENEDKQVYAKTSTNPYKSNSKKKANSKKPKQYHVNKNNTRSSFSVENDALDVVENIAIGMLYNHTQEEVFEPTPEPTSVPENIITYEEPTPSHSNHHNYGGSGYGGGGGNSGSWDNEESSRSHHSSSSSSSYDSGGSSSSYDSGSSSSDSGGSCSD